MFKNRAAFFCNGGLKCKLTSTTGFSLGGLTVRFICFWDTRGPGYVTVLFLRDLWRVGPRGYALFVSVCPQALLSACQMLGPE